MSLDGTVRPASPAPVYEIRAMSMAELLDAGFQLLKNHFALLCGLSAIGQVPSVIFLTSFSWMMDPFAFQSADPPEFGAAFIVGAGLYLLSLLVLLPFVVGAIVAAVGDLYVGVPATFGSSARKGAAAMVPLAVTYVIFMIISFVGTGIFFGFVAALGVFLGFLAQGNGVVVVVLVVLAFVIGVPVLFGVGGLFMFLPGILAAVVVLEKETLFDAITRTWTLTLGDFWRMTGIAITVYMLVAIVALAPAGLQFALQDLPLVGALLSAVVQAVTQAYLFATAVVVYFDMRCRQESFDIEHLARMVDDIEPRVAPIR